MDWLKHGFRLSSNIWEIQEVIAVKKAFPIVLVGIIVLAVLVFIVIVSPKLKPEPKVGLQSEVDVISIPSFFCDYMIELR